MKNTTDIIEEFILGQFLDDDFVNISRNDLASFFNCAPSQINYVLATRFTPLRGYDFESRRGGGGFIRLYKLSANDENQGYLYLLLTEVIGREIDYNASLQLLENMKTRLIIDDSEYDIIKSAINKKALSNPMKMENVLRANILKSIISNMLKGE